MDPPLTHTHTHQNQQGVPCAGDRGLSGYGRPRRAPARAGVPTVATASSDGHTHPPREVERSPVRWLQDSQGPGTSTVGRPWRPLGMRLSGQQAEGTARRTISCFQRRTR